MAVEQQVPVLIEAMCYRTGHHSTSDDSSRWAGWLRDGWAGLVPGAAVDVHWSDPPLHDAGTNRSNHPSLPVPT